MKARRVKLDPEASFGEAVDRILAVRIAELAAFETAVMDPAKVEELHDMRIAAKRVRYVLEVAEPAVPGAKPRAKAAKRLQEILGEIHDCDELLPIVERHVARLREDDVAAAAVGDPLPHGHKYRGLEALRAHTVARRAALYGDFVASWPKLRARLDAREAVHA